LWSFFRPPVKVKIEPDSSLEKQKRAGD